MPEIAEREPKVISVGGASDGVCSDRPLGARSLLIVRVSRRTVYALAGAGAEEMVLFTPS